MSASSNDGTEFPRRARLDFNVIAEHSIREAVEAVEDLGADVKLTEAVVLLGKARDLVADYVDANMLPIAPNGKNCAHEFTQHGDADKDYCLKCGMSMWRHAFTECP